jgi:spore coat protein H
MIKISKLFLGIVCGLLLLLVSLQSLSFTMDPIKKETIPSVQIAPSATPVVFETVPDINDLPLQDNKEIYKNDDPSSVVVMYVTVRKGNASENTNYTWKEVNSYNKYINGYHSADMVVGAAEAIVQFGDESGPLPGELGYDAVVPNATIKIRGQSTSESSQKSYKIELDQNAGRWRGQSTLDLNKHVYDISRTRNKVNFDLMKQIPNMISLRTQFVHLYVKDQTVEPIGTKFVDYGLFTQIEQPNQRFLRNHLLDPDGQLYKSTSFDFNRAEDAIRKESDPLYNQEAFSDLLEIKGNGDHSKLIRMLDDVNNYDVPIEQSFEKYFNADNYFTWMAYNILVGNVDTQNQNFYIYSPLNSSKWYILPWDYDEAFFRQKRVEFGENPYQHFEVGIATYWGVTLHSRVLKVDKYRSMLDDKINELMKFLTPERIQNMFDTYRLVVEPYVFRPPDINHLPGNKDEFNRQYEVFPSEVQTNYELYLESLKQPMPFYLSTPEISGDKMIFKWDEAYCFTPQDVTYHFEISKDFDFKKIIYENDLLNLTTETTDVPEPGRYFWRVVATNAAGKIMYSIESYTDSSSHTHDGMRSFTITPNGEVIEE